MQIAVIICDVLPVFKEWNTVVFWAKYYIRVNSSKFQYFIHKYIQLFPGSVN